MLCYSSINQDTCVRINIIDNTLSNISIPWISMDVKFALVLHNENIYA